MLIIGEEDSDELGVVLAATDADGDRLAATLATIKEVGDGLGVTLIVTLVVTLSEAETDGLTDAALEGETGNSDAEPVGELLIELLGDIERPCVDDGDGDADGDRELRLARIGERSRIVLATTSATTIAPLALRERPSKPTNEASRPSVLPLRPFPATRVTLSVKMSML